MSFQEAAGGMGWTPDVFWGSTMPDFWRHHHGYYLFHGGKDESEDLSDEEMDAWAARSGSDSPRKRAGARVITDAGEIGGRLREGLSGH